MNLHDMFESSLNKNNPQDDYAIKRQALDDLSKNPDVDQKAVQQRRLDLDREAKTHGIREANKPTALEKWRNEAEKRLKKQDQDQADFARKQGRDFEQEFANWQQQVHGDNRRHTEEGSQNFNKSEPYYVCINGKPWKRFETYAHARSVHDKLEQKFRKEGADKRVSLQAADLEESRGSATPELLRSLAQQWQDGSDTAMNQLNQLGWNIADDRRGVYVIKQSDMTGRSKIYFPELTDESTMAAAEKHHTGPEFTGYWRGTDAGTPGNKMVGGCEESKDTKEIDPKTGRVISWSHEGDWEKSKGKDPRGQVTHMSDRARRQMAKDTVKEAHGLGRRVKIVSGSEAGKTGTVGEVRNGRFTGDTKIYTVDLDDGGHIQLRATALRLIKDPVAEDQRVTTRNFVAKNMKSAGAGQHKDKKRAEKQGDVKHKAKAIPMDEAGSPAQQAAIAIAMKKDHKKPKHVDESLSDVKKEIRQLMAPAYEEETGGRFGHTVSVKAPTMDALRGQYYDDLDNMFSNARPEELQQALRELRAMYGRVEEGLGNKFSAVMSKVAKKVTAEDKKASLRSTNPCWKDYHPVGTKEKDGRTVPNCVPNNESVEEDWQKVNKKDKTAGMSKKAVKAYRREHPGSKLQTAVTTKPSKLKKGSKASKRRKSFCARSLGQKKMHNIDCSKTPDKAICAARRRWNCESVNESVQAGEYLVWTVYFDDGTSSRVRIPSDETPPQAVKDFFAKKGKTVIKIDYNWDVHGSHKPDPAPSTAAADREQANQAAISRNDQKGI